LPLISVFFKTAKFPLAIFRKVLYNTQAPAGVMGSERSAACGGYSDSSEWPWSTDEEGVRADEAVGHRNRITLQVR